MPSPPRPSTERRRRSDGEQTHAAILQAAMRLASIEGLASLTIGRIADELGVSKSGVFAHFRSKQRLQQETINAAQEVFDREVVRPGLDAPEGLAQLEQMCEAYLSYIDRGVFPGGCFFAQLVADYDARTGPIHDRVVVGQRGWLGQIQQLVEKAQRLGELDPAVDPGQLAFELYAPMELANYLYLLGRDRSQLDRGRTAVRAAITRAALRDARPPTSG